MNLHDSYIPRHARLGVVNVVQEMEPCYHEVPENVPLLDENGSKVSEVTSFKKVSLSDSLGKYRHEDFKLENLIAAGVPLQQVSINPSGLRAMDNVLWHAKQLMSISDGAASYDRTQELINQSSSNPAN